MKKGKATGTLFAFEVFPKLQSGSNGPFNQLNLLVHNYKY